MTLEQRLEAYLDAEFRRYFPHADLIGVDVNEDTETIDVSVHHADDVVEYQVAIGSDDDHYVFTRDATSPDFDHYTDVITVPLMPEEA